MRVHGALYFPKRQSTGSLRFLRKSNEITIEAIDSIMKIMITRQKSHENDLRYVLITRLIQGVREIFHTINQSSRGTSASYQGRKSQKTSSHPMSNNGNIL